MSSVRVPDRGESDQEFIQTAKNLVICSIRKCIAFPKRYTFFVGIHIAAAAVQVYRGVKKGNSIYPTNQHEAQIRRDHMADALAELMNLVGLVEICEDLFGINKNSMAEWMELTDREERLIKGVMKADRTKYKTLP